MSNQKELIVICANDYPHQVCPESTTEDQVQALCKKYQLEDSRNEDFVQVYYHWHPVPSIEDVNKVLVDKVLVDKVLVDKDELQAILEAACNVPGNEDLNRRARQLGLKTFRCWPTEQPIDTSWPTESDFRHHAQ